MPAPVSRIQPQDFRAAIESLPSGDFSEAELLDALQRLFPGKYGSEVCAQVDAAPNENASENARRAALDALATPPISNWAKPTVRGRYKVTIPLPGQPEPPSSNGFFGSTLVRGRR